MMKWKYKAISTIIGAALLFLVMTSSIATIILYMQKTRENIDTISLMKEESIKTSSLENRVFIEYSSTDKIILNGINSEELNKIIIDYGNGTLGVYDPKNNTFTENGKLVIIGKIAEYFEKGYNIILVLNKKGHINLRKTLNFSTNPHYPNSTLTDLKTQVFITILKDMLGTTNTLNLFLDNNITGPEILVTLKEKLPFTVKIVVENSSLNLIKTRCAGGGYRLTGWGAEADYLFVIEKNDKVVEKIQDKISFQTSPYVPSYTKTITISSRTYSFNSTGINGTYTIYATTKITISGKRPDEGVYSCTYSFSYSPPTLSLDSYYYLVMNYLGRNIPALIFNPNNTILWTNSTGTVYGDSQRIKSLQDFTAYKDGLFLYFNTTKILSLNEHVQTSNKGTVYTISTKPTINLYFAEFIKG